MSVLAPSEAPRGLLLILGSGALVLITYDMFWPLALLWVAAAVTVLYRDEQPDPSGRERIGDPT